MSATTNEESTAFVWRVTRDEDGHIDVAFGPKLSEAGFSDDAKLQVLGKALVGLGSQLMTSTVRDDDDGWEDEDA